MIIRLFAPSIIFFVGSVAIQAIGLSIYDHLSGSNLPSILTDYIKLGSSWAGLILLIIGLILFIYYCFRLWKWSEGQEHETCHVCSGIVQQKTGRFGDYFKCLACSATHSNGD